jgi:aldehyde dehydrogenase (NAD+)
MAVGVELMFERSSLFIANQWHEPSTADWLEVISPITEAPAGRVPQVSNSDVDHAVAAAREAFDDGPWPHLSVGERGTYLRRAGELLEPMIDDLVDLQVDEMGTPDSYIRAATTYLIRNFPRQVELHQDVLFRELRDGTAGKVLVIKEPIGVVGTIIPWNAPVPLLLNKLTTPLLLGCPVVIKPAEESALSAYLVAEALHAAGFPHGTISILPAGREVGEHLVTHPSVDMISFTGSAAAGSRVGALCGEQIKSTILELGGKSAAILLDDVDLDKCLHSLIAGSMPNSGQICFATTRLLAPRSRYEEVVSRVAEAVGQLKVGNPHEPEVLVGPLAARRQRDRVEHYIRLGIESGARLVVGGRRPADLDRGWYIEPTVFADVDNSMAIAQEEIFGPVLTIIRYGTDDEAVRLANDSDYGLGGAVYSADLSRAVDLAARIRTGTCSVNGAPAGGGGGPFGGYKRSGLGRESGIEGHWAYLETKSVSLPSGQWDDPAVAGLAPAQAK